MAVKIYKLIIEFDDKTEQIEFIEESVTEDVPDETYIGKIALSSYFDSKDIDITELVKWFSGVVGEA